MLAHTFIPVGVETFGVHGPDAQSLIVELCGRATMISGETRSTAFLRQRLDIAIQRGKAASVLGTLGSTKFPTDEMQFFANYRHT